MRAVRVGVLALQGDSQPHLECLERIGVRAEPVRSAAELAPLTHLVVPGGESTTLHHLLRLFDMWEPIRERHACGELALFGTCAGAILLGRNRGGFPPSMDLVDVEVERNAYGRQIDSFTKRVRLDSFGRELDCVFIRAPRIVRVGPDVRVLARDGDDPILVAGRGILLATFHPELADDPQIHRHFLSRALWTAPQAEVSLP